VFLTVSGLAAGLMVGATRMRVYQEDDDDDRHVDSKETISMSLAMKVDDSTQVRIKLID
jgi:hypothetical protein